MTLGLAKIGFIIVAIVIVIIMITILEHITPTQHRRSRDYGSE